MSGRPDPLDQVRPDYLLGRVTEWAAARARLLERHPGPTHAAMSKLLVDVTASDLEAVELLRGVVALFDPYDDATGGAQIRAAVVVVSENGVHLPLPPDTDGTDGGWQVLHTDGDRYFAGGPDDLRTWADELAASHLLHNGGSPVDDCVETVDVYRLLAAVMDVWHDAHPDPDEAPR